MPEIAKLWAVVGADTRDAEAGFARVSASIGGFANAAGLALAGAATAIGAAGVAAVRSAAGFEQVMSGVKAVSGATNAEMKALSGLALQLGKDTSFSASAAAEGIEELVKGGLSIADIMGGAAKSTLALAAAGGVSLPEAATIAANALSQFGLKGKDMARVADLIAGAANASALDVGQFKFSLQAAGAVAATVGFSFDDLAQAIAVMGKAGITGSDAGTSLKTMFMSLEPSTARARKEMRELGIITADGANAFFDATGKVKSMSEVAGILQNATKNLTQQQKLASLEVIFGSDAIRAAAVIAREGASGFREMAGEMGKVTAQQVGMERLNNLAGDIEQLKGSLETAAIAFGTAFLPVLRDAAQGATAFVNGLIPWVERVGPQAVAWLQQAGGVLSTFAQYIRFAVEDGDHLNDFLAALPESVRPVAQVLGVVVGTLGDLARAVSEGFAEGGVAGALLAWFGEVGTVGRRVLDWLAAQVPVVTEALGGWARAFVAWVAPVVAPLLAELGVLAARLGTWITDEAAPVILNQLGSWGAQFVAWIGPATDQFLAAWPTHLTRFLDWIEFTAAPAIYETLSSWVSAFVGWIGGEGDEDKAAGGLFKALGNVDAALTRFINETAAVLGPRLLKWAGAFLGWVGTDVLPFLGTELGKLDQKLAEWLVAAANALFERAKGVGAAIVSGIVHGILNLPNALADAIGQLRLPGQANLPAVLPAPPPSVGADGRWTVPAGSGVPGATSVIIRDSGGPGRAGQPYGIGVPEIFVPNSPGHFYPLGGAQVGGAQTITIPVSIGEERITRVVARANKRWSDRGGR